MYKLKETKGITLVALIITIIVLLILAGVSISMLLSENGLINKSQSAVNSYKEAENQENAWMNQVENYMEQAIARVQSKISLNKSNITIVEGDKESLIATVSVDNTGISWSTSNPSVATVSNGTVTAVSEGTAIITARINNIPTDIATCTVTVLDKKLYLYNYGDKCVDVTGDWVHYNNMSDSSDSARFINDHMHFVSYYPTANNPYSTMVNRNSIDYSDYTKIYIKYSGVEHSSGRPMCIYLSTTVSNPTTAGAGSCEIGRLSSTNEIITSSFDLPEYISGRGHFTFLDWNFWDGNIYSIWLE